MTGKIKQIIRTATSTKNSLAFDYDAMGNHNLFIANYKLASAKTHTGLQNPRLNDQSPARLKCHSDGGRPREYAAIWTMCITNPARMGDKRLLRAVEQRVLEYQQTLGHVSNINNAFDPKLKNYAEYMKKADDWLERNAPHWKDLLK